MKRWVPIIVICFLLGCNDSPVVPVDPIEPPPAVLPEDIAASLSEALEDPFILGLIGTLEAPASTSMLDAFDSAAAAVANRTLDPVLSALSIARDEVAARLVGVGVDDRWALLALDFTLERAQQLSTPSASSTVATEGS